MLPYLAQGANSAIEDGAVLGHLLGKVKTRSQLPRALKLYEQLRKTRGEAVVRETFKQVLYLSPDHDQRSPCLPAFHRSASLSTCRTARSRRLEMNYSSRNWRLDLQETHFLVDGTAACLIFLELSD